MEDQNAQHPAPGELELVRQFLNTYDVEDDLDEIGSPPELRDWLSRHGLEPGTPVGEGDVAQANALREALRALALANNGEPLDPEAIPTLNSVAGSAQLQVRFGAAGGDPPRAGGRGRRGRARAFARDHPPRDGRRHLAAPQGLPRGHLRVGLLRPLQEPLGHVVLDGGVRKPQQGARLPGAPRSDAST